MTKNDGGPAFPCVGEGFGNPEYHAPGMSLRDWFAGQAPVTYQMALDIWGSRYRPSTDSERSVFFAVWSFLRYEYADAMLAEKEKGGD